MQQTIFSLIVLGMHRSGTSCLTGCLQEAGLYLGAVNETAPANAKGNRENRAIMDLHEDVLAANGVSWDNPRPGLNWARKHVARRRALIANYPADQSWGFKDPRSLLALDGWLEDLPAARLIGTFRHPLAVASSLNRRNGFAIEKGYQIWTAYNSELLRFHTRFGFDLISFDLPPAAYLKRFRKVAAGLGLGQVDISFFEAALRCNDVDAATPLPEAQARVYAALCDAAQC